MDSSEEVVLKPIQFPPLVLNAIAPDISLQRHLSLNLRPSLRGFEEFQNIQFQVGDGLARNAENAESPILGSSVVKCGPTTVICTITGGIIEAEDEEFGGDYTSVYPVVEIARGKISGPPTDEEMIIGQHIHELILKSKIIPTRSLDIDVGLKVEEDGESKIVFSEDDSLLKELTPNKKNYSFVFYANVQVFSRSGPLFDLCYGSVITALRKVKLPVIYIDENVTDLKVNTKNRTTITQENHKLLCHSTLSTDLKINTDNLNWSVTFGVVKYFGEGNEEASSDNILLADIEGDAEEACTTSRINVVVDRKGGINSLDVINGSDSIVIQEKDISKAISLATKRVKHVLN